MSDNIKYECTWNPETDITAYELALCVPLMGSRFHEIEDWKKLGHKIRRNFDVAEFDYGDMIADNAEKLRKLF